MHAFPPWPKLPRVSEIAPGLLIAVPQLADPNFERSVVLMIEHGESGAMGIVINRPAGITLGDVARSHDIRPSPPLRESPVFVGGPVEPERGFVLHARQDLPEFVPLFDGMNLSGSMETLKVLLEEGPTDGFRLCLGYAGWGPGPLEKELQEGSWLTAEAVPRHILETPPDQTWSVVLREMGIDPAMLLQGGGLN